MDKSIFKFIFRHTRPQQFYVLFITAVSLPFYYASLDIPKLIVNSALEADDPNVAGDEFPRPLRILGITLGDMDQMTLLFTLCFLFLALVCINGGFKMYINVYKGRLGERMLRRLRYILYSRILRFPLPHFRKVSSGELIPMITAEVEPLGGFIGDAVALPALQGGLLLTAIFYIFSQDPFMGLAAISLYPMQAYFIPKLQRRVNLLAKDRVREVRKLSDRIGESVSGVQEIHAHGTAKYELADFSRRLGTIYEIRYKIYNKKFFIKFLNNFLAQLTPFFFFSIGGYLVIQGDLTIGSLVAVLAAYKDLAPPWKELLQYYQIKEDVRIKYDQVVSQFEPHGLMEEAQQLDEVDTVPHLGGEFAVSNLSLQDEDQVAIVSGVSMRFPLNSHVAVVGSAGSGKEELMLMLARLLDPTGGRIAASDQEFASMPESVTGRRIGFVGHNAYVFAATLKDNIFYGLKQKPVTASDYDAAAASAYKEWQAEAGRSGNSDLDIEADWVDYAALDVDGLASAVAPALDALEVADMSEDIYQFGLRGALDPEERPEAAARILEAREALEERLKEPEFAPLVESFDVEKYNDNATLAENLIFGSPRDATFDMNNLADHPYVKQVIEKAGLTDDLLVRGHQLAATMIELFADLPPDHELFQRFSFISADDLPDYQALIGRVDKDELSELTAEERTRLLSLPFRLIPARHRLGLIDEEVQKKILAARRIFREDLPDELKSKVEVFDHERYNAAATLQDNILFGKVAYGQAQAAEKIGALISEVIEGRNLRSTVMEVGLDHQAGIAGTRLSAAQRQKLAIARSVLKQPDVIIVSEATAALESSTQNRILKNILTTFDGRGVIWSLHRAGMAKDFDHVIVMKNGGIVDQGSFDEVNKEDSVFRELMEHE